MRPYFFLLNVREYKDTLTEKTLAAIAVTFGIQKILLPFLLHSRVTFWLVETPEIGYSLGFLIQTSCWFCAFKAKQKSNARVL